MNADIYHALLCVLVGVSLAASAAALIGLTCNPHPYWKAIWLTTGALAIVNGLIGLICLAAGLNGIGEGTLRLHIGVGGGLVAVGAILCIRPSTRERGIGLALTIQSLIVVAIEVGLWLRID